MGRSPRVRIALFYIMYNEEKIISRHLESLTSLVPLLEGITVVTNGKDNTIPLMREWCNQQRVPFVSHYHEFDDFGHQRYRSYQENIKAFPRATHDMTLDADHCLVIDNRRQFIREIAAGGCLLLKECFRHSSTQSEGWNRRIFARSSPFECWLRTHEIWITLDRRCQYRRSYGAWIDDKSDGASHDVKYERDVKLLLLDLAEINHLPAYKRDVYRQRVTFYLAQSYYSLHQFSSAAHYYQLRTTQGGFEEEIYIAYWKGGVSHEQLARMYRNGLVDFDYGTTDELDRHHQKGGITMAGLTYYDIYQKATFHTREAIRQYQQATAYRPSRGEALYDLVRWYGTLYQPYDVLEGCHQGNALDKSDDNFLVNPLVYDYLFDIELRTLRLHSNDPVIRTIGDEADRRLRDRGL